MSRVVRVAVGVLWASLAGLGPGPVAHGQESKPEPAAKATPGKAARKKARTRPAAPAKAESTAAAAGPADDGKLVFARDIAPILVANCTSCHNPKDKERRGKFDLSSFEALMAGTPTRKVVVAGNPDESHLVLRIKGEETPRMPLGGNRKLSDASIARIERWVREGAILDAGRDPKAALSTYAASPEELRKSELAKQSPSERDQRLETVGRDRYKKGDPKADPESTSSPHFFLLGTLPKDRANAALRALENEHTLARGILGPAPLDWGEKASVYVFNDARAYGEFIRAVENRDVDATETASAKFGAAQPYVAVIDPLGGKADAAAPSGKRAVRTRKDGSASGEGPVRSLGGVAAEAFVAAVATQAGKAPRWVTLGLGAFAASKVDPRSPYYQAIRREAFDLWRQGWTTRANDALGSATKASEMKAVGLAAYEYLNAHARPALIPVTRGMMEGQAKLDEVLQEVLGATREQFLAVLGEFVGSSYGR